jgi:hypothetical protein
VARRRGSDAPDAVCRPAARVEAYGGFGRRVRVPTLWLYADNDHYFAPALAQRFFASFQAAGGTGTFVKLPAFGSDGHLLLGDVAVPLWRDRVDGFLREHRLPTWTTPVVEAAATLPAPRRLSSAGREAFEQYRASSNFEKAFAVDGTGNHYGWATGRRAGADAAHDAVEICAKHGRDCKPYAINNTLTR